MTGQYRYTPEGTGHADAADLDSHLTAVDQKTGEVVSRFLTKAGASLIFRGPEAMAVQSTGTGELRLLMGFASRSSLDDPDRWANLFFKNVLID